MKIQISLFIFAATLMLGLQSTLADEPLLRSFEGISTENMPTVKFYEFIDLAAQNPVNPDKVLEKCQINLLRSRKQIEGIKDAILMQVHECAKTTIPNMYVTVMGSLSFIIVDK